MQAPYLILALACLSASLAGCLDSNGPPKGYTQIKPELSLVAEPAEFEDLVTVTLTMNVTEPYAYYARTDMGPDEWAIQVWETENPRTHPSSGGYLYDYQADENVYTRAAQSDPPDESEHVTDDGSDITYAWKTIEPGTYTEIVHWNGHHDLPDNLTGPHVGDRMAPGEYTIRAQYLHIETELNIKTNVTVLPVE